MVRVLTPGNPYDFQENFVNELNKSVKLMLEYELLLLTVCRNTVSSPGECVSAVCASRA